MTTKSTFHFHFRIVKKNYIFSQNKVHPKSKVLFLWSFKKSKTLKRNKNKIPLLSTMSRNGKNALVTAESRVRHFFSFKNLNLLLLLTNQQQQQQQRTTQICTFVMSFYSYFYVNVCLCVCLCLLLASNVISSTFVIIISRTYTQGYKWENKIQFL